jgi:uncharacterized membrane protein YagU involved in acid resistance
VELVEETVAEIQEHVVWLWVPEIVYQGCLAVEVVEPEELQGSAD